LDKPKRLTLAQRVEHLEHENHHLRHALEKQMATSADLATDIAALATAVANLPAATPQLITQAELDAADASVKQITADLQAKTPPTP
jgi:hypothetical protein